MINLFKLLVIFSAMVIVTESSNNNFQQIISVAKSQPIQIYKSGIDPKKIVDEIKSINIQELPDILGKYYEISTTHWNQELNNLTTQLEPILLRETFEKIVTHVLKNRLAKGIIIGAGEKQYFVDHLPELKREYDTYEYPADKDFKVIKNEPLKTVLKNGLLKDDFQHFKGKLIEGKEISTERVPVGYSLLMPSNESLNEQKIAEPKGLIIRVYGGSKASDAEKKKYVIGSSADILNYKFLKQGYAVAHLNLADLHFNEKFQAKMLKETFEKVIDGINLFINVIRKEGIHQDAVCLANKEIFLMGESFGGATITGYMRKFPKTTSGGIIWSGALCRDARQENFANYLEPSSKENLEKLHDHLLLLQPWNDNRVVPAELKLFLDRAASAGKKELMHPFMVKVANKQDDNAELIGHSLRALKAEYVEKVFEQILCFLENPKNPSEISKAVDTRRENIFKSYAPLNSKGFELSFEDYFKGVIRKAYEEKLYTSSNSNDKNPLRPEDINAKDIKVTDFEDEWKNYYLPIYLATIFKMKEEVFEYNVSPDVILQAKKHLEGCNLSNVVNETVNLLEDNIKQLLEKELKEIGLAKYLTHEHITFVQNSIKNSGKGQFFSKRIFLEALANYYVKAAADKQNDNFLYSGDIKRMKLIVKSWINQWKGDSARVWRKTLIGKKEEIAREIERLKELEIENAQKDKETQKNSNYLKDNLQQIVDTYFAKISASYFDELLETLSSTPVAEIEERIEFTNSILNKIFEGRELPIKEAIDQDDLVKIIDTLFKVKADKFELFKNIFNGSIDQLKIEELAQLLSKPKRKEFINFVNGTIESRAKTKLSFVSYILTNLQEKAG